MITATFCEKVKSDRIYVHTSYIAIVVSSALTYAKIESFIAA